MTEQRRTAGLAMLDGWAPEKFVAGRLVLELARAIKEDPLDRNQQSEAIAYFVRAWLDGVLASASEKVTS